MNGMPRAEDGKMKAVVCDRKALVVQDVRKPAPGDGEVLVKIHVVALNAADYRSMRMGIIPKRRIFGADIAARVVAAGKNAGKFSVGDEVFGDIASFGFGGLAEYAAVPERALALVPAGIEPETAAAVPMAAVTALQALRNKGELRPGQKVLIVGAGGGVGSFAVQLARHLGAEVTAVCGEKNAKAMQSLGAGHVINYQAQDFTASRERYDLILAVNGNHSLSAYRRLLAPKGICVVVGGALSQVMKALLFGALLSVGGRKVRVLAARPDTGDLEYVIRLVRDGTVTPIIDKRYPLSETADAMAYLGSGHARGKVIIRVEG